MKVLVVARLKNMQFAPFITEQVEALKKEGVCFEYFGVTKNGITGYLRDFPRLKKTIDRYKPDLIHAHYGLCGVLANFQRRVPVVTTYHGSDINNPKTLTLSRWAIRKSAFSIFVSQKTIDIAKPKDKFALIPCGINLEDYQLIEKKEARESWGLRPDGKYVLFAGSFDNEVKNAALAKAALAQVPEAELLELKGLNREQVAILMQAVDALLLTSFTEGSPQVIKEAMACGCPIVSVDVGDIRERISGIDGCRICKGIVEEVVDALRLILQFKGRTAGREAIIGSGVTNDRIAQKIVSVYKRVLGVS